VEWGTAERSLSSLMPVMPMSVEGLGKLMAAWNGAAQPSFEEWQAILPEQSPPKLSDGYRQPDPSEVFMELYRYLGNEAFMWLCACAVYPELYFELTCILHDEAIPLSADLSQWQRNERWNQALRLLSRLDWFRKGDLPETLAEELKKNLTPADLLLVEGEIKRILAISKNQVSDQSYAAELRNELFDWLASQSFRVLWIDDRPQNNQQYRDSWSKSLGIHFKLATTSSEAHGYLNNERFDLVISDLGRPGEELTGQITLDIVAKRAPVVFFTNKRGLNLRGTLLSAGVMEVTNSVGVLSELVRGELRKKFPSLEQVAEVPDLDLSGLENVEVQEKKPKKEKAATQKKATKKAAPPNPTLSTQEMLQKLGFYHGDIDKPVAFEMIEAIKDFQRSKGLLGDGIAGAKTREAMEKAIKELESNNKSEIPESWRSMARSVCRIVSPSGNSGNGFLASDGYVYTAKSVLPNATSAQSARAHFININGDSPFVYAFDERDFVADDNNNGFVRMRLNNWNASTFAHLHALPGSTKMLGTGDNVSVIYFKTDGNLTPNFALDCPVVQFSRLDFSYEATTSGSVIGAPALNESGEVVGITTVDENNIKRGRLLIGVIASEKKQHDHIKDLIANAEIEKAIDEAMTIWPNRPELIQLSGRHNKLQKDNSTGIIAFEDYQRQSNQITSSLLELLDELEQGNTFKNKEEKVGGKLNSIQSELRDLTAQDIGLALKRFRQYSNRDSFYNNSLTLVESRYNNNKSQLLEGVIADKDAALEFNEIRRQLITMIGELEENDLLATKEEKKEEAENNSGYLFYRMPKEMQVGVEYDCMVRLGFKREMLLENLETQGDEIINPLKISDVMAVELTAPNSDDGYSIETIHDSVQFIEKDLVTEWLFQITPLKLNVTPLVLKISNIEMIEGQERKRDEVTNLDVKIIPRDRPRQSYK
jgi:Effector-associated domain 11/Putative peptidoglycan binding domain